MDNLVNGRDGFFDFDPCLKISRYGSKSKNRFRPSSRLFIFLSVAKNRLLITSKTAALCDPQKNGTLK